MTFTVSTRRIRKTLKEELKSRPNKIELKSFETFLMDELDDWIRDLVAVFTDSIEEDKKDTMRKEMQKSGKSVFASASSLMKERTKGAISDNPIRDFYNGCPANCSIKISANICPSTCPFNLANEIDKEVNRDDKQ